MDFLLAKHQKRGHPCETKVLDNNQCTPDKHHLREEGHTEQKYGQIQLIFCLKFSQLHLLIAAKIIKFSDVVLNLF